MNFRPLMAPTIIPRSQHCISRRSIDPDAIKVLNRLYRSGHTAYLVGGCVRDLLLQRQPKDFDIVTSARPAQVKKLFRNCRLIGRRFRLAHIHFLDGKIIELSTFRAQPDLGPDQEGEDLMVKSDNKFGTPLRDAERRDFTINSIFYDISTFSLIDYVGSMEDVQKRILRTIGDPYLRFQEDPVRMIRAVKFSARLGFEFEKQTWDALVELAPCITRSPQPRVIEELARLLEEGAAERSFALLDQSGLLEFLEPNLEAYLRIAERGELEWDERGDIVFRLLRAADRERQQGRRLPRPLLFALWVSPLVLEQGFLQSESPDAVIHDCVTPMLARIGLPRKDIERVELILSTFRKLFRSKRRRKSAGKPLHQRDHFNESLLLLKLWVEASGEGEEDLERWTERLADAEKAFAKPHETVEVEPEPEEERTVIRSPERRRKLRRRRIAGDED